MAVLQPRVLCAVSALFLFAATPVFALAITLTPTFDHPGAKIAVSGSGFGAYAVIDIYFDTTDELVVTANANGSFLRRKFQVPADASPGQHWVTAVERNDGKGAQRPFLVSASWAERGYDSRGRRSNPYETVLTTKNVDRLGKLWVAQTGGGIESVPAVVDGTVYLSANTNLYAFSADTGALLWTADIHGSGIPEPSPAVANGVVYVAGGGIVQALDAKTGAAIWSVQNGTTRSSPTVIGGVLYIGSSDSHVYALDATTGAVLWATRLDTEVVSTPAVAGGKVYVGTVSGPLYALDADTGDVLWNAAILGGTFGSPAVADGIVYAGSDNMYAFDASTGATLWTGHTRAPVLSSPAVANGIVYAGSRDRTLYAFDARKGDLLWGATFGDEVDSSPAVANGVVYVGSEDYNIYALDAATGTELWSAQTGSFIEYASPAVSDGVVYIGSLDAKLYAYALDGGKNAAYRQRHTDPPSFASLHPDLHLRPETPGRDP
jgi:outer membrane protein assembly factor BamB